MSTTSSDRALVAAAASWFLGALCCFAGACRDGDAAKNGSKPESTQPNAVRALENREAPLPTTPLANGAQVYDFSALAHNGQRFQLSQFLRRPVLVYFCPSDATPGCEQLALSLRDGWLNLNPSLSMAFGVTLEDTFVHRDFASAHELPHLLVADSEQRVHRLFGVTPGTFASYLIGEDRTILHVFAPPSGSGHANEVVAELKRLGRLRPAPPR